MGQSISQLQDSLNGKSTLSGEQLRNIVARYQGWNRDGSKTITTQKAVKFVKDLKLNFENELLLWIEGSKADGRVFFGDLLNRILARTPQAELTISANQFVQDMTETVPVPTLQELFRSSGTAVERKRVQKKVSGCLFVVVGDERDTSFLLTFWAESGFLLSPETFWA